VGLVVRDDEKCFPLDGSNLGARTIDTTHTF
jgi:hypothetical protein